ncbi:hypothetical protein FACS1894211_07990 [Clostridia bacterium]|nr:hypothetical protein FACS1894211_07990 [Clostridia bacterium]
MRRLLLVIHFLIGLVFIAFVIVALNLLDVKFLNDLMLKVTEFAADKPDIFKIVVWAVAGLFLLLTVILFITCGRRRLNKGKYKTDAAPVRDSAAVAPASPSRASYQYAPPAEPDEPQTASRGEAWPDEAFKSAPVQEPAYTAPVYATPEPEETAYTAPAREEEIVVPERAVRPVDPNEPKLPPKQAKPKTAKTTKTAKAVLTEKPAPQTAPAPKAASKTAAKPAASKAKPAPAPKASSSRWWKNDPTDNGKPPFAL